MKRLFFFAFGVCTVCGILLACHKLQTPVYDAFDNPVRFNHVEKGQRSRFVRFSAESCRDDYSLMKYAGDTLVLEVLSTDENGALLQEAFTPGSSVITDPGVYNVYGGTLPYQFYLKKSGDNLVFTGKDKTQYFTSRLFAMDTVILSSKWTNTNPAEMVQWYPFLKDSPRMGAGYMENYVQMERKYPHLNVLTFYAPLEYDGSGLFWLYDPEYGIIRAGLRSGWCRTGVTWDILPD